MLAGIVIDKTEDGDVVKPSPEYDLQGVVLNCVANKNLLVGLKRKIDEVVEIEVEKERILPDVKHLQVPSPSKFFK